MPDASRLSRSADDGDRFRIEKRIQGNHFSRLILEGTIGKSKAGWGSRFS
jgi:hypothetical protein